MKDDRLISLNAAIKTAHLPVIDDAGYEVVRVDDILALPSVQLAQDLTKGCTDAVSRQGVLRLLNAVPSEEFATKAMLISGVNALPPAQPERKNGKWIYGEDSIADGVDGYRCDQCGFFVPWDYKHKSIDYIKDYNFCPKCGSYNGDEQDG